jgi:transposase InsO family protein
LNYSIDKVVNIVNATGFKMHYYSTYKKAENLLNREFEQQTLNTHWVGDITYIKTSITPSAHALGNAFAFAILYKCVCTVLHALIGVKHAKIYTIDLRTKIPYLPTEQTRIQPNLYCQING